MNKLHDKSINNGGRVDTSSKIYGSMYFTGNAEATTIALGDTWYRIGAGNTDHEVYSMILPSEYWVLEGEDEAQDQELSAIKLDNAAMTIHCSITAYAEGGESFEFRVVKRSGGVSTIVPGTLIPMGALGENVPISISKSTIAKMSSGDSYFIEVQCTSGAINITVSEASLIFTQ